MSLFGPKYISLNETELYNNELFVYKQVTRPNKKTVVVVPATHNVILIKDNEYSNILPQGKHPVLIKGEKGVTVGLFYVSKTRKVEVKWGTLGKFDMRDDNKAIKIGIRGEFKVSVTEPRKAYLEFVDSDNSFSEESLQNKLRNRMCNEIQPIVAKAVSELGINLDELGDKSAEIAERIKLPFAEMLKRDYGLMLDMFIIDAINVEEV